MTRTPFGASTLPGSTGAGAGTPKPACGNGIITGAAWGADDRLYLAITTGWDAVDYQPLGKVMIYDAGTGELADESMTPESQRAFDLALCPTGHVALADAAGGVRVYDPSGSEMTDEVLDLGLPPVSGGLVCY